MFINVSAAVMPQFVFWTLNSAGLERDTLEAAQGSGPDHISKYRSFGGCQEPAKVERGRSQLSGPKEGVSALDNPAGHRAATVQL